MNIEEVHIKDGICIYKNAFSEELCDGIWDFFYTNIDKAGSGRTAGGYMPSTKHTIDFDQDANQFSGEIREQYLSFDNRIYSALRNATAMYLERFDTLQKCPNMIDTGYLWQMYRKGEGFYKEHIDGDQWSVQVQSRILAIVAYVNTVETGGETYFRFQDVAVKPEKGTVCLFPAHWMYPHQAMVPLSSDKLIISSFVNSV